LLAPANFVAVGRWYDDFSQLSDDDVRRALSQPHAG
jgi:predicted phosphoribosyltransferase